MSSVESNVDYYIYLRYKEYVLKVRHAMLFGRFVHFPWCALIFISLRPIFETTRQEIDFRVTENTLK